jgi:site-specific recombinase XerD
MERLRYLTVVEAARLKDEVSSNRDRAIVGILLHTGMRIGECAGLQVRDFDFEAQTIRIERIVVKTNSVVNRGTRDIRLKKYGIPAYNGKRPISLVLEDGTIRQILAKDLPATIGTQAEFVKIGTKAHGDSGRTVPLTDQKTWQYLRAEIDDRDRNAWAWKAGFQGSPRVETHGRYSYTGMRDMVIRAMLRAGIPREKAHPHTARHTFAVHFLKNGGDLRTLQRIGGWSNINMVARYLEFVTEDLVDVSRRVKLGF